MLGPAAGVIGSLQALEAMKLLTGVAPAIADGFLQVDLATAEFLRVQHLAPRRTARDCARPLAFSPVLGTTLRRVAGELKRDVAAAHDRDPAARGVVVAADPRRVAGRAGAAGAPARPRAVRAPLAGRGAHARARSRARSRTSRSIRAREIGDGLFIDHGTGVVIGETAEVGDNVTIYQGVTLGGTGFATGKRHPTVEDNVTIGSGAKLLGPITIGHGSKIGANSVVIHDVPPNSTVVGVPGHPVRVEGVRPEGPDADWAHLPDPVADAVKMLSARVAELESASPRPRAPTRPPTSSRCATGAARIPPEAEDALREHGRRSPSRRRRCSRGCSTPTRCRSWMSGLQVYEPLEPGPLQRRLADPAGADR